MDCRLAVALASIPAALNPQLSSAWQELAAASLPPVVVLERFLGRVPRGARRDSGADLLRDADRAIARGEALGLQLVPWGDPRYPPTLRGIPDPPPALWLKGLASSLAGRSVAIVGARAASAYALEVAERLAEDVVARGVTVVSGLARGVDAAAHRGALGRRGRTVAVVGCGLDIVYPPEHGALAEAIATSGCLVSELPPGTPPRPAHFPRRNRLISGLSQGVVVVEASWRSGSLITARLAADQGREVLAVPGNALSGRNAGAHALLKDGAKLVETADDILDELGPPPDGLAPPPGADPLAPLLEGMRPGEGYDLDALVGLAGLNPPVLLERLLELELSGDVTRDAAGRFMRRGRKVIT